MPTTEQEKAFPPQCALTIGRVTMIDPKGLEIEVESDLGPQLLLVETARKLPNDNDSVALVFSEDFGQLLAAAKAALETFDDFRSNGILAMDDDDELIVQLRTAITASEKGE